MQLPKILKARLTNADHDYAHLQATGRTYPAPGMATLAKMQPLVLTSLLAGIIVALGYVLFLDHHL